MPGSPNRQACHLIDCPLLHEVVQVEADRRRERQNDSVDHEVVVTGAGITSPEMAAEVTVGLLICLLFTLAEVGSD